MRKAFTTAAASAALIMLLASCGGTSGRMHKIADTVDLDLIPSLPPNGRTQAYVNTLGEPMLEYSGDGEFGNAGDLRLNLFHNGMAAINTRGSKESRFIDSEGNVVIDCSGIAPGHIAYGGFSEGIAFIRDGHDRITAIDTKGNILFEMEGELQSPMLGGFALYSDRYGRKLGAINSKGEIVLEAGLDDEYIPSGFTRNPAHLSQVPVFGKEGFMYVLDLADGKHYLEGVEAADQPWLSLDWNNCAVCRTDGLYGLMSAEGEWLIEPQFSYMANDGDWYVITQDNMIGWCDKNGKMMIEPQFEASGHAAWGVNNTRFGLDKWAWIGKDGVFIDREGKVALECEHYAETNFIGDRCLVTVGGNSSMMHAWMGRDGQLIGEPFINDERSTYIIRDMSRELIPPYPQYEMP